MHFRSYFSLHLLNCVLVYVIASLRLANEFQAETTHVHRRGYVDEHGLKLLRRRIEHEEKRSGWFVEKRRSQSGHGLHGRCMSESAKLTCVTLRDCTTLLKGKQDVCSHQNGVCRPFVEPLNERGSSPFTNLSCMASAASPSVKHLTWEPCPSAPVLQRLYELCCQCRGQNSIDCYQNHLLTYRPRKPCSRLIFD